MRNRPRNGHGDAHCAPAARVRVMETHLVRRPVYGGPARQGLTGMAAQRNLTGGPGVLRTPGRRPPHRNGGTFGSFSHERTTIIREVGKKMAAELSRQVSCKATPARANREKINARGADKPPGFPRCSRDLWFFRSANTEIVAIATTVFRPKPLYCISAVKKAQNLAPGAPGAGPPQSTTQPRRRRVGT